MNTTKTLLPATRVEVPASTYNITGLKTLNTSDGYAYTATLRQGTHPVARLEQQGNGGSTMTWWATPTYEQEFKAYAEQHDGKWGTSYDGEGFDWDEESALEALVTEVILERELNRKAKKAILLLTPECPDPNDGYNLIKGTNAEDPRLEAILAKYAPTATHYWANGTWTAR